MLLLASDSPAEAIATSKRILRKEGGNARHGLQTTDDFRFLRLAWEVDPSTIGKGQKWFYFAKGGEYQPYWDDLHLTLNWENDGEGTEGICFSESQRDSWGIRLVSMD